MAADWRRCGATATCERVAPAGMTPRARAQMMQAGPPTTLSHTPDLFIESVSEPDSKDTPPGQRARGEPQVLHAIDPGPTGLPDRAVATLMRESARQGADVAAAVIVDPGSPAISEWMRLESAGVRVFCYAIAPGRYLRHRARYAEAIRDWHPALVHCHGPRGGPVGRMGGWEPAPPPRLHSARLYRRALGPGLDRISPEAVARPLRRRHRSLPPAPGSSARVRRRFPASTPGSRRSPG